MFILHTTIEDCHLFWRAVYPFCRLWFSYILYHFLRYEMVFNTEYYNVFMLHFNTNIERSCIILKFTKLFKRIQSWSSNANPIQVAPPDLSREYTHASTFNHFKWYFISRLLPYCVPQQRSKCLRIQAFHRHAVFLPMDVVVENWNGFRYVCFI